MDVDPIVRRYRVVDSFADCHRAWRQDRGGVVLRRESDPGAALVGGVLGSNLGRGGYREEYVPSRVYEVERCHDRPVERWQEQVVGYSVSYVFEGREYRIQLPYDPGRRLRVDYAGRPF